VCGSDPPLAAPAECNPKRAKRSQPNQPSRRAAACVELAVLAPFLVFMFVITVDYGRVFYYSIIVENAARKGAFYGCQDSNHSQDNVGIQAAALADATDLSPLPTVKSTTGIDKNGNTTISVTVACNMKTITNFPGIPSPVALTRTVTARVIP
jgi:Flp pilus assembly protein TadG